MCKPSNLTTSELVAAISASNSECNKVTSELVAAISAAKSPSIPVILVSADVCKPSNLTTSELVAAISASNSECNKVTSELVAAISAAKATSKESTESTKSPETAPNLASIDATSDVVLAISAFNADCNAASA